MQGFLIIWNCLSYLEKYMLKLIFLLFLSFSAYAEDINDDKVSNSLEGEFVHNKAIAKVQILNKITAKAQYLEMQVNSEKVFGTLLINVKSCWKSSPYDAAENKILLHILEKKNGEQKYKTIFEGWMFSSSPGISSLEHSIYDLVAIDCFD